MTEPLTKFQRAALEVYAGGDYSYVDSYRYDASYGDALLNFVMAELSDNEDCETLALAIQRIESGIEDLQTVLAALEAMPPDLKDLAKTAIHQQDQKEKRRD